MSHSKVSICNIALAMLGADSIRTFDEKNKRARMADVFFDSTRDYLLSQFDWPFARVYLKLNEVVVADVPPGMIAYQLPNDCRTPRDLWPPGSKDRWRVMQNVLYAEPARTAVDSERFLYYTKQELDTSKYSDTFVNLLALGLAVKMSPSITQDKQLTAALMEQFAVEKANAWESDANIGNDYRTHDEDPNNDTFVNPDGWWEDPTLRIR